jgi:sugar phosphate isomerase/epimerase
MQFIYFTKELKALDVKGLIAFCKEVGVDGVDMAVRPGYPVNPDNALTELPTAARALKAEGLVIGLVSAETNLNDPNGKVAQTLFEACGKAEVPALKLGYFPYRGGYEEAVRNARARLAAFAKSAEETKVRACYHTHSGNYLGCNAAGLRMLLQDLDPHHVGAFVDTGHTAINGGPIRMELDILKPWLAMIAIKDMVWEKNVKGWSHHVAPAGEGIVEWSDVALGLKECKFNGTISLHAEYETKNQDERLKLAKQELAFLKKHLGGSLRYHHAPTHAQRFH